MTLVKIPFKPYFKEPMLSGVKVCTARTKYMGHPGDRFLAFGAEFEIVNVEDVYLLQVAMIWKEEGCESEEHFKQVWQEIHPVVGYQEYQRVKLHHFRKVER